MIHAAVVDFRGSGVLLPAWGGVGKTSTVAKLVAMPEVRFMADDWAFLGAGGMLMGYAKPMFIKPHHRAIYPELFQGTRKPLAPGWLTNPVAHLATAVHPVIVRYPKTAAFTRRWSPEHRMVHPEQVFGPERISSAAPAQLAIFLERYDGAEARLEARSADWMTSRIVGNFHSELPHGLPTARRSPRVRPAWFRWRNTSGKRPRWCGGPWKTCPARCSDFRSHGPRTRPQTSSRTWCAQSSTGEVSGRGPTRSVR